MVNDLDVDFSKNLTAAAAYKNDKRNIRKVREASNKLKIDIITPLRAGKKLLVLDIDYSAFASPPAMCWCFNDHYAASHLGHQTADIWSFATFRVRTSRIARVLRRQADLTHPPSYIILLVLSRRSNIPLL